MGGEPVPRQQGKNDRSIPCLSNEIGPCRPYGFQGSYCVGGTSRERGRNAPAHTVATHYKLQRILVRTSLTLRNRRLPTTSASSTRSSILTSSMSTYPRVAAKRLSRFTLTRPNIQMSPTPTMDALTTKLRIQRPRCQAHPRYHSGRRQCRAYSLFRSGWMESWGRGIANIMEACEQAGLPKPEFVKAPWITRIIFRFKTPLTPYLSGKGGNGSNRTEPSVRQKIYC